VEKERFDQLINDNTVIKIYEPIGGVLALYKPDEIIIDFVFMYTGHPGDHSLEPKRIIFKVFPLRQLSEAVPLPAAIGNYTGILTNADNSDYAILFAIRINSEKRTVKMEIEAMPEMGEALITDEEKNGIEIVY
jgi:hypothetical protein